MSENSNDLEGWILPTLKSISDVKLQTYLDIAGVMFIVIASNQKVQMINKKGCEILEAEFGDIVGVNWFDNFISEEEREIVKGVFNQLMRGDIKPVEYFENNVITKKKNKKIIAWHNTVIQDQNGKIIGTLSSGEDITERKRAEEHLVESEENLRNAYKQAEFYKDLISHDINNILQSILSAAELGSAIGNEPQSNNKVEKFLEGIKIQVERGARLINNVQKLSTLSKNLQSLEISKILGIIRESKQNLKERFPNKKIEIKEEIPSEEAIILVNELLVDIFDNILINAVLYNDKSTIEILIRIKRIEIDGQNYIRMEFIDNGKGIKDIRKKLVFERGSNKEKSMHGMGLGLSLVKQILDIYQGEIWIEDRVKGDYSQGSKFIIRIPEVV